MSAPTHLIGVDATGFVTLNFTAMGDEYVAGAIATMQTRDPRVVKIEIRQSDDSPWREVWKKSPP